MMSSSGSTNKSGAAVVEEEEDATQPRLEESPSVPTVSQSNQSSTDKTNQNTSEQSSSNNPSIIKSVRSAWKKAKFRHWRKTMDLENSKKECQETQEESSDSKINGTEKMDEQLGEQKQNSTNNSSDQSADLSSNPGGASALSIQKPNSNNCVCTNIQSNSNVVTNKNSTGKTPTSLNSKMAGNSNQTDDHKRRISRANYQVDYTNYLIPKLKDIFSCPFYWGKMDRYEAEALLANKPEGSFLLRDSAQENYVFSVSFRRYSRSLHARIEETKHKFSFDCHDPGVHASRDIKGLLEFYKDPLSCMFFEPMLLFPILRKKPFSLQELSRTVICDNTTYNGVTTLPIPKTLKSFLREYHYKHKVESRELELNPSILNLPSTSASTASMASEVSSKVSNGMVQKDQPPKND